MKHMQMVLQERAIRLKNPEEKKRERLRYGRTCKRMTPPPPYRHFLNHPPPCVEKKKDTVDYTRQQQRGR
jgi:hypothetical protein